MATKQKRLQLSRHVRYFVGFIIVLLATIVSLSFLRTEETNELAESPTPTYTEITDQLVEIKSLAEVRDSSVITIYAQTGGVVTSILKEQGEFVYAGSQFLQLSSTYSGANAAAIQASIAQKQLDNYEVTYDQQLDTIELQRELSQKQSQNQEELRKLGRASSERTEDIIDTNQESIDEIEAAINQLSGQEGTEDLIEGLSQTLQQLEATQAQLISTNDVNKYQASEDNPPAGLANLQRDLLMKQFEIQEEALNLSGEILKLQTQAAGIAASLYRPASPFSGELIEVYVNLYDQVSPGMPLATIKATESDINLITYLPFEAVEIIDETTSVRAQYKDYIYNATVTYVADYPTKGDLYAVTVELDTVRQSRIPNNSFIELAFEVPTTCNEILSLCYLPLDAVTVTEKQTFANYLQDNDLASLEVDLLAIVGDSVKISGDISNKVFVLPFTN